MLKCHIVRQLIPNYIDGLLDEESRKDVEEHLSTCADCDVHVKSMRLEIVDSSNADVADAKQIKYLKRFRKRTLATVLLVVALLLGLFFLFLKLFFWGSPVNAVDITVKEYTAVHHEEDGLLFLLDFELRNGKVLMMDTKYLEDENGILTGVILTPRAVANNPLDDTGPEFQYGYHLSSGGDFRITIRYKDDKVVYDMRDWVNIDG